MIRNHPVLLLLALLTTTAGCSDRAAQIAEAAAQRQAEQNVEMAKVNQGVLQVTDQLHQERAGLTSRRDDLETERRAIAGQRRTESALMAAMRGGGTVLAALFALALAWALVTALPRSDDSAEMLCELLASDLSAKSPQFIEPLRLPGGDAPAALSHDPFRDSGALP
jgi:hypothetical protein